MKPTVIFVGSFKGAIESGGVGGQMYACRSLIDSPISDHAGRTVRLLLELLRRPRARVLVFAGDGPSFAEKGLMVLIARLLGHHVVFSPRSGMVIDDFARSRFFRWFMPLVVCKTSVLLCQSARWDLCTSLPECPLGALVWGAGENRVAPHRDRAELGPTSGLRGARCSARAGGKGPCGVPLHGVAGGVQGDSRPGV